MLSAGLGTGIWCCTVDHDDNLCNWHQMMEVKMYLCIRLYVSVARKCQVYVFLLRSTLIIFHSRAKWHEPVKFGNPSCIHLPYEKYM